MRADVTNLDWVADDFEAPPKDVSRGTRQEDKRRCARVNVKLRVAVNGRRCAFLAESVDISESGILLDNYRGPKLRVNRQVDVIIQGLISDGGAGSETCRMVVTRIDGTRVALRFD